MADIFTPEKRREIMSLIRGRDTTPELIVRRALHGLGYRYRLHRRDLPGTPDLVFPRLGKVIFVHGCFWHRHGCRTGRSTPATRAEFWAAKFEGNRLRDRRTLYALRRAGWQVAVVWECRLKKRHLPQTVRRLVKFLDT